MVRVLVLHGRVLVCCFVAMEWTTVLHTVKEAPLLLDQSSPIVFPSNMWSPQLLGPSVFPSPVTPVLDLGVLAQEPEAPESNPTHLKLMVSPSI